MGRSCLLLFEPSILAPLVKNNHLRKSHQLLPIYVQGGSKGVGSAMAHEVQTKPPLGFHPQETWGEGGACCS